MISINLSLSIYYINSYFPTCAVVQDVLAIAGGYNESKQMSQTWSVVMQNGSECSGEVTQPSPTAPLKFVRPYSLAALENQMVIS